MAYGNITGGQAQMPGTKPIEPTSAEQIGMAVNAVSERMGVLRDRLQSLAARAIGSGEQGTNQKDKRPVPSGALNAIVTALSDVGNIVEDCHSVASTLERIA